MPLENRKNLNNYIANLISILIPLSLVIGNAFVNILSLIIFLFCLLDFLKKKNKKFFQQKYLYFLTVCYLVILISFLNSEYSNETMIKVLGLAKIIILPICFQYFFCNYSQKLNFVYACFLITLFVCLDGLFQYKFSVDFFGSNIPFVQDTIRRLSGIFFDELILGSYVRLFAFFGVAFIFLATKKKILKNVFAYIYYLICLLTIFLSQERSAFFTFVIVSGIIFIYLIYHDRKKIFYIIVPILILSFFLVTDKNVRNRYMSIFSSGSGFGTINFFHPEKLENKNTIAPPKFNLKNIIKSFTIKNSLWGAHFVTSYSIYKNNILFGSGPKTFRYECDKKKYEHINVHYISKRCSTHPHNFVMEILSDLGLIGFMSFFITFIYIFYSRLIFLLKSKSHLYKFCFASFLLITWPLATTGSFFSTQSIFYTSLVIGLMFSYNKDILLKRS